MIAQLILLSSLTTYNVKELLALLLEAASKSEPKHLKVAIVTVAWDYSYLRFFVKPERQLLIENNIEVVIIDLKHLSHEDLATKISTFDVIYAECGNTYALKYWSDKIGLLEALEGTKQKLIYVGSSAGAIIVGKDIRIAGCCSLFDDLPLFPADVSGWSLINQVIWPHYNFVSRILNWIFGITRRHYNDCQILKIGPNQIIVGELNRE
ncbi:MAG: Type 1 glutamine amidotransferase-like domain-containing protein [bacterium]